eukprot:CAMPEP_0206299352 /NCGR_PEP_ID=MMETSP0106_2-20121207/7146_1 /ASSEMBLY_ACC=CAM_ASM_000206 /TAXON_ID=81532 /ORGANISM="Acanthoeca-like sp., Strain 10tr" /LENGTH=531 /DNA_ID=CAMNT_0053730051 /DNA_START=24 /DNA_END=1617 /DNA_ORIENTATION=+
MSHAPIASVAVLVGLLASSRGLAPVQSGGAAEGGDASGYDEPILFAFTGGGVPESDWSTWDWGNITHLGFWTKPSPDMAAKARSHNVKFFQDCSTPKPPAWTDASQRASFAEGCAQKVKDNGLDGVFFDFEGNGLTAAQKSGYTALAKAVKDALTPLNASLFICVGGRPSYELRNYPYADLVEYAEFLFIMMYDMHLYDDYTCATTSQGNICSPAEASIRSVTAGTEEYLKIVPGSKLVMGFPWYGQRYTQVAVPINEGQVDYKDVLAAYDAKRVTKTDHDKDSDSQVATCNDECIPGKKGGKVWYDDADTLAAKYAVAVKGGIRGLGMWTADKLPTPVNGSDPHFSQRNAMWVAIGAARAAIHPNATLPTAASSAPQGTLYATSEKYPSQASPDRLAKSSVAFDAARNFSLPTLTVSPGTALQSLAGFGGAITEAVATVFGKLPKDKQDEVVEALWGPTGQLALLARAAPDRLDDFAVSVYSYNNHDGDLEQTNFTIDHDDRNGAHDLIRRAAQAALAPPVASAGGVQWL